MSKTFSPKNVWLKNFLVQNDSAPKMFWVQRNLEFKETWAEKFGSFKIIADRFLIKTKRKIWVQRSCCCIYVRIKN